MSTNLFNPSDHRSYPSRWPLYRGKQLFRVIDNRSKNGMEELLSVSHLTGITPRSQKNVTMFQAESLIGYKLCKIGDIVANTMWTWQGAIGVSDYAGVVSPAYNVYRQSGDIYNPRYLDMLLRERRLIDVYHSLSTGIRPSRLRLYPNVFLTIRLPVPQKGEQDQMVRFLDWKISQVNRLSNMYRNEIAVPFILMFCLHIGIALGNYFGININVPNVDASTWFIFCGSYLGGTMTLAGVMVTLRHERGIHQYEKAMETIEKERDGLGKVICELNLFAPSILYQRFNSLHITSTGYNSIEVATIRQQLAEEMQKINTVKLKAMFFTDIYAIPSGCSTCKNPCRIPTVLPEFQKTYEKISNRIFTVLEMIDSYIAACDRNAIKRALVMNCQELNQQLQSCGQPPKYGETELNGYESEIINVESQQNDIITALTEISKYSQAEIPQLNALAREYIATKQQNAYKNCFPAK